MKYVLIFFIKIYQKTLSPYWGTNCKFTPTCSQYAIIALKRFGAVRGTMLAANRILRCNPFSKEGFDFVPDNLKGEMKWLF